MDTYLLPIGFIAVVVFILHTAFSYRLPKNLPRIPIWITLYDTFFGTSRIGFYDKYVRSLAEKHGAVILWHLGNWTVQITNPEYLIQMFRDDTFAKGGSYTKVPWGALGKLFGENIIDTTGPLWKKQREILQPTILRPFDIAYMKQRSSELRAILWREHEMRDNDCTIGIDIDEHVQHWSLSICCKYFMGFNLKSVPDIDKRLTRILTNQKIGVMAGITMVFPILQRFPWLFPSNRLALRLIKEFEEVVDEIITLNTDEPDADNNNARYALNSARKDGAISEFHYRSNMKQVLLAGFEEVEAALLSTLLALAKNPQIQSALHTEISTVPANYTLDDLDKLPLLLSVILETLRLHPPFPSLTNRYTKQSVVLGNDISLPAGIWVGWNAYAVQTNVQIWGPDAFEFRPDRWGKDVESIKAMFRAQQAKAAFITFSSRSRTCMGVAFALMQLKIVLYELLNELEWGVYDDNAPTLRKGPLVNPSHCKFIMKAKKCSTVSK